jgi:hypothetical protein
VRTILKLGVDKYTATCAQCGTVFTYERSDVRHNYVNGGEDVGCPHCAHPHRHFGYLAAKLK